MNVAFGLVSRESGGAEFQTCLLADALRRRGHAVVLYCLQPEISESMLGQFHPEIPARVLSRVLPPPLNRLVAVAQWRSWLHRDRIDVAVGVLGLPHMILSLAALTSTVRLLARRSCDWREITHIGHYARDLRQLRTLCRAVGWRTGRVVANSPTVAKSARTLEGWPARKIQVIPNGWPECPAVDGKTVTPWYVARPRAEKAMDLCSIRFASAGMPLAVSFEPPPWAQVGILAHGSRSEGMSNAVGMAMAHGIPVVAFDLPGNRQMLEGGFPGALVPCWDYDRLVRVVTSLMADRATRETYGRWGRDRAQCRWPLTGMVEQWEEVLCG